MRPNDDVAEDRRPPDVPGLQVVRRLGSGAHAQVWLARRGDPGEQVAVKVARPQARSRLAYEADLLDRVRHPHLVRLLDRVDLDDGGLALVLEYAAGGSLAALVSSRGRLEPGEVTTVVVPVARALATLHDAGLVHGDVTAANVLLTSDGRPVLADLGVATFSNGPVEGLLDGRWGTPGWTDPEARGSVRPSPDVDVWALGALVRYCLTGDPCGTSATGPAGPGTTQAAALSAVARRCEEPAVRRPRAAEVSRLLWAAGPPSPVALPAAVSPPAADPAAALTRRIREDAGVPPRRAGDAAGRRRHTAPPRRAGVRGRLGAVAAARRAGRGGRSPGTGRAMRWLGALASAGFVGLVVAGWLVGGLPTSSSLADGSPSTTGSPSVVGSASTLTPLVGSASTVTPLVGSASVPARPSVPHPVGSEPAVADVVRALAQARAGVLTAGSVIRLADVDAGGSPAYAADAAVLERLVRAGVRYEGLGFAVGDVQVRERSADRLAVTAAVSTSAYRQLDAAGHVLAAVPASGPTAVSLVLVRTVDGWRVHAAVQA